MFRYEKLIIHPDWKTLLRARALDSVEAVFNLQPGSIASKSRTTQVFSFALDSGDSQKIVFVKKYWVGKPQEVWKSFLRGSFFGRSKVKREYHNLLRLRQWGLGAPEPIAYGEDRRARCLFRSFIISAGIAAPIDLSHFIKQYLLLQPAQRQRQLREELIATLARFVAELHAHSFVHHDLFWRNIILSGKSLERLAVIDAPKGRRWWPGTEQRSRVKDLATLDAPAPVAFRRTERLKFFLRYVNHSRLTPADKKFVRAILRSAAPQRERQIRLFNRVGRQQVTLVPLGALPG